MNGFAWLIWLAQQIAAGIIAKGKESFLGQRDAKTAVREFNSRIVTFNRFIPRILDKVLLAVYPDLRDHVLTIDFEKKSRSYPVVQLLGGDSSKHNVLTISRTISNEHDEKYHSEEFLNFLKESGKKLWDNDVFRLLGIGNEHELIIGITRYYKALTSCDRFFFNLVEHFPLAGTDFRLAVLAHRSFLRKWRNDVQNIIVHRRFNHLSAAVGISVLTVIARPSKTGTVDYFYPIVENSNEKNGARAHHVIPAFMYEPFTNTKDRVQELDLEYQVLREFGEEIAGIPELRSMMHWEAANAVILRDPACKDLHCLLQKGDAVLKTTGLWLDLFRLRPEITCALIIPDEKFYTSHIEEFKGSWENNPGVRWHMLTDELAYKQLMLDTDIPLCPPAVAALVSGRQFAINHLGLA